MLCIVSSLCHLPLAQDDYESKLLPLDVSQDQDSADVAADTADTLAPNQVNEAHGPNKLKIIKRTYNYREQLGLALGMMAFIAVIFTTTQNWNPD